MTCSFYFCRANSSICPPVRSPAARPHSPPLISGFPVELVSHWSAALLVVGKPSPAEPRVVKMHLFLRMTARSGPTSAGEAVGRRAATAVPAREECGAGRRWPRPAAGQCRPLSDRGPPSERPPDEKRKVVGVVDVGHAQSGVASSFDEVTCRTTLLKQSTR